MLTYTLEQETALQGPLAFLLPSSKRQHSHGYPTRLGMLRLEAKSS